MSALSSVLMTVGACLVLAAVAPDAPWTGFLGIGIFIGAFMAWLGWAHQDRKQS